MAPNRPRLCEFIRQGFSRKRAVSPLLLQAPSRPLPARLRVRPLPNDGRGRTGETPTRFIQSKKHGSLGEGHKYEVLVDSERRKRGFVAELNKGQEESSQRFPLRSWWSSMASNSALMFPTPKPWIQGQHSHFSHK